MQDEKNLPNTEKIFRKIEQALVLEQPYQAQSLSAYSLYSPLYSFFNNTQKSVTIEDIIDQLSFNSRRSNIYYANIETLKGLVLPQVPSLSFTLNPSKKTENNTKDNKNFYEVVTNILQILVRQSTDNMPNDVWEGFKLDYLVTGRGVLWASVTHKEGKEKHLTLDHVRWQDFAYDVKPQWKSVGWVARRLLFTKRSFKKFFADKDLQESDIDKKISGTTSLSSIYTDIISSGTFNDTTPYIEVWEFYDKLNLTQYFVSRQYNVDNDDEKQRYLIKKETFPTADPDHFLPTPQPPILMYNGINTMPISDVWTYINELNELSDIVKKRTNLISSLHLRGYTSSAKAELINELASSTYNGFGLREDDQIVSIPDFTPNADDPLIFYVDNQPRIQLLTFLQDEYKFLVDRIYSLTGISEQMRNVTSNEDDETATSVRLKSKFGSRRLKEHQQRLLNYWTSILKILFHKICQTFEKEDLKNIFSYDFRDSNKEDIENVIMEREDVLKHIQAVQLQLQQMGGQQQPQQEGADAGAGVPMPPQSAPQMPPPPPLQAQPETNQGQMQGMQGADLPVATTLQKGGQGAQTTPFGMLGQPQQQTGVDEDIQDSQIEDAASQAPQSDSSYMGTPSGSATAAPADTSEGVPEQDPMAMLQQQDDQLQQQLMQLDDQYDQLTKEITWDRIIQFLRSDSLVSFLVSAHLDDLENKIIADEKKNSDLEYINTITNLINQIIANVTNNPKFAEVYTSLFSLCLDNFDQTKAQRDAIDQFVGQVKNVANQLINNPPPPPPPTPDDQLKMAQAGDVQAQAQLRQAQIQEIQAKIQKMQYDMQQSGIPAGPDASSSAQMKMQEMQMKHNLDMELQQAKIQADQLQYQEKNLSDRQLLQMKIEADKQRYEEKKVADFAKEQVAQDKNGL